jgi:PKD repeat protein
MKRTMIRAAIVAALTLSAIMLPGTARAAAPLNDSFASATLVSSLPFSDTVDVTDATYESGEPACTGPTDARSVWYDYTPSSNETLRLRATGQSSTTLAVYTGSNVASLSGISGCSLFGQQILVNVTEGTTYRIRVAAFPFDAGGLLTLDAEAVPAPANDGFAGAKGVGGLPYSDSVDATAATIEAGEPTPSCGDGQSAGSIWYAFTPSTTGSYTATSGWNGFNTQVAAYQGTGLANLTDLGCRAFSQPLTFHAVAGETYYLQVGGLFGGRGTIGFSIDVAPNPVANFALGIGDPNVFDTIQFYDYSQDPAQVGIQSRTWNFGDGTTSTDVNPQHRYATDGDYTLKLAVETPDGRKASTQQVIHVRTHDVAVTSLSVPSKGRVGRSSTVVASLSNLRYPETVQVQLYKSVPNGLQLVGTLQQTIPVTGKKKSVPFSFNYTFTSDDAGVGKVTFQAVATIVNARDALPSDNTALSLPVPVVT